MSAEAIKYAIWILLTLILVATLTLPIVRYLSAGWSVKRKDIMDGLAADARLAYFEMFSRSDPTPDVATASANFEALYEKWYGRRFFILPALLLTVVALTGSTFVVASVLAERKYMTNPLFDLSPTAIAALAGAYLWTVNDFTSRARRLDFAPSDVHWGTLRLIIAMPMGYAFAAVASESAGPFVAFALGAFPLATLTSMLRRLATKRLGLDSAAEETSDNIIKLQGINAAIVERLLNEDITTVTQVAYCDPVQVVMRSNLTFNFITDTMNQALAWLYLEDDLSKVRPLGLRGAVEIKNLIDEFDDASEDIQERAAHERAVAAFPLVAKALGQDPATLQITFREIAEDPYTIFLCRVWT